MAARRRKSNRRSRKYKGGSCPGSAANYVSEVSSTGGSQLSVGQVGSGVGNALHYNAQGGEVQPYQAVQNSLQMSQLKGGKKEMKKEGGSGILTDLAVPALFVVAQRAMSKRPMSQRPRTKKRYSYRKRR